LIVVVVVLALVFGFGFWLTQTLRQVNTPPTTPTQNVTSEVNANTQLPNVSPPVTNTNQSPPPSNINVNANLNINASPPTPPSTAAPPSPTLGNDIDADDLLDPEEVLFGSSRNNSDTDGDGFSDIEEVLNGYDPSSSQDLVSAGLVNVFQNETIGYQVLIPKSWGAPRRSSSDRLIIVIIPGGSKIEIQVRDNTTNLTPAGLFFNLLPQSKSQQLSINNNTILLSSDKLNAIIMPAENSSSYYFVTYTLGTDNVISYPNVLEMMVRSLKSI